MSGGGESSPSRSLASRATPLALGIVCTWTVCISYSSISRLGALPRFPGIFKGSLPFVLSIYRDMADSISKSCICRGLKKFLRRHKVILNPRSSRSSRLWNATHAWNVLCGVIQLHDWGSSVLEAASKEEVWECVRHLLL